MENISGKWPRNKSSSRCIKSTCRRKVEGFSFPQPNFHGWILGKILKPGRTDAEADAPILWPPDVNS